MDILFVTTIYLIKIIVGGFLVVITVYFILIIFLWDRETWWERFTSHTSTQERLVNPHSTSLLSPRFQWAHLSIGTSLKMADFNQFLAHAITVEGSKNQKRHRLEHCKAPCVSQPVNTSSKLTSSSLRMVAASLVTRSFSKWLMTILFMPGKYIIHSLRTINTTS